jgi:hypothetical protein
VSGKAYNKNKYLVSKKKDSISIGGKDLHIATGRWQENSVIYFKDVLFL